jgi:hypothetical protein
LYPRLVLDRIEAALREGSFDPQHAGEVFLRSDAAKAIGASFSEARLHVNGKEEVRGVGFIGARFTPDIVVESGGQQAAVTITLLRGDASPVTTALAGALVLSARYPAVVAFILDRRLAKRNPFDDPSDAPAQRELSDSERSLIEQLDRQHNVRVVVRQQDPFGW